MGRRPLLLERQPIHPVPGGRSFSSGVMAAPFHTDSQAFLGVPPHVQVMACVRAAQAGGESLYLDTWALLARVEREDVRLFEDLFAVRRPFPFVFGDVFSPTVALRGGSLVFTHSPRTVKGDDVAARLRPFLESQPAIEVRAEAGDLVCIHNHRLLHGRRAFEDPGRSFTRLLLWRDQPWPAPEAWAARALLDAPPPIAPDVRRRLAVVLELLRGTPPGVLSRREGVSEAEIYGWRDAALAGATTALAGDEGRPAAPAAVVRA